MEEVSIYLYSTVRGPRQDRGAYTYVLEMKTKKGPVTLTHTEAVKGRTAHQVELDMLAAALERIFRKCSLTVYTDSKYLAAGVGKWMEAWRKHGWKTARGQPVANLEAWQKLACLVEAHSCQFITGNKHGYYEWMRGEAEKAGKCIQ